MCRYDFSPERACVLQACPLYTPSLYRGEAWGGWALASQLVNSLVESDWMALLRCDKNIRRENQVRGSESLRVAPLITLLCGCPLLTCSLLPWIPDGQPGV